MKINEELQRLLATEQFRQAQPRHVGSSGSEGFESLLATQMAQSAAAEEGVGLTSTGADPEALRALADPLRLAGMGVATIGGVESVPRTEDASLAATLTSGLGAGLDSFERYASSLQGGSGSLRDAWAELDALDRNLAGLRQDMGKLSQPDAELDAMLNELEVLTATEKFKFNRGDYLPA